MDDDPVLMADHDPAAQPDGVRDLDAVHAPYEQERDEVVRAEDRPERRSEATRPLSVSEQDDGVEARPVPGAMVRLEVFADLRKQAEGSRCGGGPRFDRTTPVRGSARRTRDASRWMPLRATLARTRVAREPTATSA
jgi:hypothetical protein